MRFELPGLNYAIPVGISFFTFQAIGYFLDVYFKKIKAEQSFSNYLLFVSFFPQITSGPISKASELLPQIKNPKPFNEVQATDGLRFLLWGMFFKVAVADRLGIYVDTVFANYQQYSSSTSLFSMFLYSFQIYADFAGYSFMALGIAKLLGFDIINNFNQPYLSIGITDFWRRWHISLSRWLRDYIYIPLGGSRCSKFRNYLNIIITFLVSGIWHGANYTFVVWGFMHGAFQVVEKALGIQKNTSNNVLIKIIRISITFVLITLAWVFFRMPTLSSACDIIKYTIEWHSDIQFLTVERFFMSLVLPVLILRDLYCEYFSSKNYWWNNRATRTILYLILLFLIISTGVLDSGQFIYVSF